METTKKIEEIIEIAITEKTFSLDIIDKIKSLKDEFENVQDQLKVAHIKIDDQTRIINDKTEEIEKLRGRITELTEFKNTHEKKAKEYAKTEYELSFQKSRAEEIKELFGIVFKNPVVQRSVTENKNSNDPNNYQSNKSENSTKTEIENIV